MTFFFCPWEVRTCFLLACTGVKWGPVLLFACVTIKSYVQAMHVTVLWLLAHRVLLKAPKIVLVYI